MTCKCPKNYHCYADACCDGHSLSSTTVWKCKNARDVVLSYLLDEDGDELYDIKRNMKKGYDAMCDYLHNQHKIPQNKLSLVFFWLLEAMTNNMKQQETKLKKEIDGWIVSNKFYVNENDSLKQELKKLKEPTFVEAQEFNDIDEDF